MGERIVESDAPLDARTLRATRDFFRRMDMDEAAEHCEQLALGIDSGIGVCEESGCAPYRRLKAAVEALTWNAPTRDAISGRESGPTRKVHVRVRDLDATALRLTLKSATP